jgi:two-component system, cell cycle sensor histidine kinase and response regulator CckA
MDTIEERLERIRQACINNNHLEQEIDALSTLVTQLLHERRQIERNYQLIASGAAHDINNYNSTIMMSSDIAATLVQEPRILNYLDHISRSARRSSIIANQLLGLHHISLLHPDTNLNDVVGDVATHIRRRARNDLDVVFTSHEKMPLIKADEAETHSIVYNLAKNAFDAMADNGGKLTLEVGHRFVDEQSPYRELTEGKYYSVRVQDTGPGIPEHFVSKVFEPSFSTKNTPGMGLWQSQRIARHHGGDLVMESTTPAGSKFIFYVPAAAPRAKDLDLFNQQG